MMVRSARHLIRKQRSSNKNAGDVMFNKQNSYLNRYWRKTLISTCISYIIMHDCLECFAAVAIQSQWKVFSSCKFTLVSSCKFTLVSSCKFTLVSSCKFTLVSVLHHSPRSPQICITGTVRLDIPRLVTFRCHPTYQTIHLSGIQWKHAWI